ncbi:PIG-L deacetylase family protein [Sporomusa acidovorans]|uniref:N-acetyl-alpha-D-glucosaminyl L-malate deacetylase 1 n=1 Tax=Sporomusa acidovorans (strain ATCC 49682 / DSM 3132 / Mol) TaxID=1123286 RepID=A0ABZ3J7M1_SPOA4|nr:PIG-L deacetylase family protein [Sporomusa acidovorans]OZC23482.1 GlcNAc-PI de-N-acetylase [Sporomusa acidovorans DSM 3132]SDF28192.1 N-acetylglucosaminyl deacetylase, LmbE family [Sporomusa acidovorans]
MEKIVLVLAPHTDDGEFGCGGTVVKLISQGYRVVYVAFSAAEQSVLPQFPKDILRHEVLEATSTLGIKAADCIVLNFAVRKFPELRQDILEKMVLLNKEYQPEIVFLPSANDTHQDHLVIAQEGFRAFKKTTMLGYEVPWNNLNFRTTCFYVLAEAQLQTKINALQCYRSQQHRSYATEEFIRSLAITRGTQISQRYAEVFEVMRLINK